MEAAGEVAKIDSSLKPNHQKLKLKFNRVTFPLGQNTIPLIRPLWPFTEKVLRHRADNLRRALLRWKKNNANLLHFLWLKNAFLRDKQGGTNPIN